MYKLWRPNDIKEILGKYGFHFSKSLGQNFLINPSVCPQMAESCGADEQTGVLEVGPGIGVLTAELSQVAEKVVAVELDKKLLPVLSETLKEFNNVKVIQGDILKLDIKKLIDDEFGGKEICICANLPYYITSPVIMAFLEGGLPVKSITVMVQREAAKRLCALPGSRDCGAISVGVHYRCVPEIMFEVGRGSFMPPPNVDSAVIKLHVLKVPAVSVNDETAFFRLVKAAFGQRRKTLVNSVSSLMGIDKKAIVNALQDCGLNEMIRAERLTLEDFAMLSNCLSNTRDKG